MKKPRISKSPKHLFRISIILSLIVLFVVMVVCIYDHVVTNSNVAKKLHLDIWDWFALLVAAFSLLLTTMTWWSQDQTRENTTRLNTEDYRRILVSCYYNIVRNTINLYSLSKCLEGKYSRYYPSEEYLQKMKLYLFDASLIPSQNTPKDYYGNFQRIEELCRYFNYHIDATQKHLSSGFIDIDIKKRDMETLKKMHWLIASEILKTIDFICPNDMDKNIKMVRNKFIDNTKRFCSESDQQQETDKTSSFFNERGIIFLTKLFNTQQDYDTIINMLISAIESRLREFHDGDNSKIPLIPIR